MLLSTDREGGYLWELIHISDLYWLVLLFPSSSSCSLWFFLFFSLIIRKGLNVQCSHTFHWASKKKQNEACCKLLFPFSALCNLIWVAPVIGNHINRHLIWTQWRKKAQNSSETNKFGKCMSAPTSDLVKSKKFLAGKRAKWKWLKLIDRSIWANELNYSFFSLLWWLLSNIMK